MISVIIPVYNVEQYLDICVDSARKLKTDVEIILVDDGSTDRSGILCDDWAKKDPRVRVIHQENAGLSAARNTGIRNCTGEHVLFLDSDDFLDPAATEELLACQSDGADVLLGMYCNYYTDQDRYEPENSPALLEMNGRVTIERFLRSVPEDGQTCYMTAWRFVPRREFLLENNLFFLPGILHEDEEWTQRMLCCADCVHVSHAHFYQYRQARVGAITSVVKPKSVWDTAIILERTLQMQEKYKNVTYKREYLSYRAAQHYLNIMFKSEVLDQEGKKRAYSLLEGCRRQCLPYLCGTLGLLAKGCIRMFGVKAACGMLQRLRNAVHLVKKTFYR